MNLNKTKCLRSDHNITYPFPQFKKGIKTFPKKLLLKTIIELSNGSVQNLKLKVDHGVKAREEKWTRKVMQSESSYLNMSRF